MGEVWRARDTRLQREVALKILPELFAADADRLLRFQREAQALAALNHPHIAQIYGYEEAGGVRALAMELVEGEDLSERIARGAIPPTRRCRSRARWPRRSSRAREGDRPPRPEAGERQARRQRQRQGARLRDREKRSQGTSPGRCRPPRRR